MEPNLLGKAVKITDPNAPLYGQTGVVDFHTDLNLSFPIAVRFDNAREFYKPHEITVHE